MPLTKKGEKIERSMEREYGPEKGEQVFYASRNKGTISGVDSSSRPIHDYLDAVRRGDAAEIERCRGKLR